MKYLSIKSLFPILLIVVALIVCVQNYRFGTYLSGWDSLHPEFNFGEYFKRIFSVWQEHQGLGAVAAQAHAAELPRVILMYLMSLVLPLSFLRYAYFFLTLILGPLGVYFFSREFTREFVAFLAGLFFLLNLTTVQQYAVPLEMFATLYAAIGWIFLFAFKYILNHKKRDLFWFTLVTIFSAPMAHTPTLFYIFFICLIFYIFFFAFLVKKIKQAFFLAFLMIALNSYWILPNLYFIANYSSSVANSKIHSQFSDRAFQVGRNFGDLPDTAIMKNFLFDWGIYNNDNGTFIHLLNLWSQHLSGLPIRIIGNSIFLLILLGSLISIYQKNKIGLSLLPTFVLSYFFIANDNIIFEYLSQFLRSFSVLKEALRFPFTKFSIPLLFAYCVYFGLALTFMLDILAKFKRRNLGRLLLIVISISLFFYMQPIFFGYFINSKMRVEIPKYYFDMFNYFKNLPSDGRIASFPVHTFWGWSYYNWDYEGAGFLWFGLKQPLLNREFDRWHPANEQFYWEVSYAVYKEDLKLLESVLDKYQVRWLLLDFAVTDASSAKSPYLDQISKLLIKSQKISEAKSFGTVKIYQVENPTKSKDFIAAGHLPKVGPGFERADIDTGFVNHGHYFAVQNSPTVYISENIPEIFYPFRSLFTNHTSVREDFELGETADSFIFRKKIPESIKTYKLNTDEIGKLIWFDREDLDSSGTFLPKVSFTHGALTVEIPKVKGYFSQEIDPTFGNEQVLSFGNSNLKNCDFLRLSIGDKSGEVKNELLDDNLIRLKSKLANNCSAVFSLNNLTHSQAYLISFEARNVKNKSLLFWLENTNIRRSDLEVYLPQMKNLTKFFFIQPPLDPFGTGYTLHFDNWSFNKNYSINDLGKISVYPLPYTYLINISLSKMNPVPTKLNRIESSHPLPYLYIAKLENAQENLILYQSYDPGWYAFGASKHFLVNNWANGWEVDSGGTVVIIFLPQLLQFLGFGVFGLTLYYLINAPLAGIEPAVNSSEANRFIH